jgi:uncharacterized protein (DUF433 family)
MATLRSWVRGRPYPTQTGERFFRPLIEVPRGNSSLLSFINLVEAHVLAALRRRHRVSMRNVRKALDYLKREMKSEHPLAEERLETDGLDLFVDRYGKLINLSQDGQYAMRELLAACLERVEYAHGSAIRLFPFTRSGEASEPRLVVIDPAVSFGKPIVAGTGIRTVILAERFDAGESIEELATDYGLDSHQIQEAIRYELAVAA